VLPAPEITAMHDPALPADFRLRLIQLYTVDRPRFDRLLADPGALSTVSPEATPGDMALATGEYSRAIRYHTARIMADPENPHAWAGLARSGRRGGVDHADAGWTEHPHLVRALHRRLRDLTTRPPEPTALAEWIGRAVVRARDVAR
jgi:hypothetical protein